MIFATNLPDNPGSLQEVAGEEAANNSVLAVEVDLDELAEPKHVNMKVHGMVFLLEV